MKLPPKYLPVVLGLLFVCCLLLLRTWYTGTTRQSFLLWNLFLAGVPLCCSQQLHRAPRHWMQVCWLAAWLAFFPNALYIVTDLKHLVSSTAVPQWFDLLLFFTAAAIGLFMGYTSLYDVEAFLRTRIRPWLVQVIICTALFLGAFGVYLGRFLRWNSWDLVVDPTRLFREIAARFLDPFSHPQTWAVTILFTLFFLLIHFAVAVLRHKPGKAPLLP